MFSRENPDGSASCFVAAQDYITRTFWQVEVRLPKDAEEFETHVVWYNSSSLPAPYYHWMNAAYSVENNPQFLFPGKRNPVALVQGTSFDVGPSPEGVWRLVALDRLQNAAEPAVITVK